MRVPNNSLDAPPNKSETSSIRSFFDAIQIARKTHPNAFFGTFFLMGILGVEGFALAWLTKILLDQVASGSLEELSATWVFRIGAIVAAQAAVLVGEQILSSLVDYLRAELSRETLIELQSRIFSKINSFETVFYFEDPRFHDSLEISVQSAQNGIIGLTSKTTGLLRSTLSFLVFLIALITLNPALAVIVVASGIPTLLVQFGNSTRRVALVEKHATERRRVYHLRHLLSGRRGSKELRQYQHGPYLLEKLLNSLRAIHNSERVLEIKELHRSVLPALTSTAAFILVLTVVVVRVSEGLATVGDIALFTSAARTVQSSLSRSASLLSLINQDLLEFRHFKKVLALPKAVQTSKPIRKVSPLAKQIEFHNISFRYSPNSPWVLRNLNLVIRAGECLGIVGLNGAGKSTLIHLLTRLYEPQEGSILWDGVPINEFDTSEFRNRIGAIFQDYLPYPFTAQENIGFGSIENIQDFNMIVGASMEAGAHDFITHLPEKYNTILSRWLGENSNGTELSGGQWQKIAIARALIRNPDIFIFDEPTSTLDPESEYVLHGNLRRITRDATTILISHRFSTLEIADEIALLSNGRISEKGTHAELISLGGDYSNLYFMQSVKYALNRRPTSLEAQGAIEASDSRFL